jgi:hypothetical protein
LRLGAWQAGMKIETVKAFVARQPVFLVLIHVSQARVCEGALATIGLKVAGAYARQR